MQLRVREVREYRAGHDQDSLGIVAFQPAASAELKLQPVQESERCSIFKIKVLAVRLAVLQ